MPLQVVPTAQYLHRKRIFIDPYIDNLNVASSMYNITIDVPSHPQKIQSIEITDFMIPHNFTPAVFENQPDQIDNNWVDVRIADYPAAANTLEFSFRLPSTRFYDSGTPTTFASTIPIPSMANIPYFINSFAQALNDAMEAEGDATFNAANNWAFYVYEGKPFTSGVYGGLHIEFRQNNVAGTGSIEFLFSSGANATNSAWKVLGFDQGIDTPTTTVIDGTTYVAAVQDSYLQLNPYRYIDVTFDEVPELRPHSRLWTTHSIDYKFNPWVIEKVRLLTQPLKRLETLTTRIRMADGLTPNTMSYYNWLLTLDMLVVSPETNLPDWINQFLSFD